PTRAPGPPRPTRAAVPLVVRHAHLPLPLAPPAPAVGGGEVQRIAPARARATALCPHEHRRTADTRRVWAGIARTYAQGGLILHNLGNVDRHRIAVRIPHIEYGHRHHLVTLLLDSRVVACEDGVH